MGRGAFEIQTVPRFQPIMFRAVEPDLEFSAEDVQKFFPFVSVGFATATVGFTRKRWGSIAVFPQASNSMRTPAVVSRIFRWPGRTRCGFSPAASKRDRIFVR